MDDAIIAFKIFFCDAKQALGIPTQKSLTAKCYGDDNCYNVKNTLKISLVSNLYDFFE